MKTLGILSLLLSMAGAAWCDATPMVRMSGKTISATAPSITFTVKSTVRDIPKTRVFSMAGQEIAELSATSLDRFTWDGKDINQEDVPSGLYVVQIHQHGAVWHGPVVVSR